MGDIKRRGKEKGRPGKRKASKGKAKINIKNEILRLVVICCSDFSRVGFGFLLNRV